jgi:arsenate reductase (thioredoxin)
MAASVRALFVCVENAGRSQIAEAFARQLGIEAYSAGSKPSGQINPIAIEAMREVGYDLTKHRSKSLDEVPHDEYDYVVTMGCGDACPFIPAKHRVDWNIPDPKGKGIDDVRAIRDQIGSQVRELLNSN